MVNRGFANGAQGRCFLPEGEEAQAVFARVGGEGDLEKVRAGGQQIAQAYCFAAHAAAWDAGGPPDEERDSVAAFVNIGLMAAEHITGVVADAGQFSEIGHRGTAVIRGERDEGIFSDSQMVQQRGNPAHHVVHMEAEIAVFICAGFSLESGGGQNRGMGCAEGKIEKEGAFALGLLGDPLAGFFRKAVENFFEAEIRRDGSFPPERFSVACRNGLFGHCGGAIIFHVDVRGHIQGSADAEEIVEARGEGAILDRL